MTDFVLHTGLPKTGTTTLQNALFPNHPQIHYIGKSQHFTGPRGVQSREAYRALQPVLWQKGNVADPALIRRSFGLDADGSASDRELVLGSWEGLGMIPDPQDFATILTQLQRIFGRSRLLITLRNPLTWAPSEYLQQLRSQYLYRNRPHLGFHVFVDFDEWMRRMRAKDATNRVFFTYGPNIRAASEAIGKENVGVFLFEDFTADPIRFGKSLCRFMGIDGNGVADGLANEHRNPRMTQAQMSLLQHTEASLLRRLAWRCSPGTLRTRKLIAADGSALTPGEPARIVLSEAQRESISAQTGEANRWIAEEFGLDLERHGYPLR